MKKIQIIINSLIILLIYALLIIEISNNNIEYKSISTIEIKKINTSILMLNINNNNKEPASRKEQQIIEKNNTSNAPIVSKEKQENNIKETKTKNNNNLQNEIYVGMKLIGNMVAYGTDCCSNNENFQGRTSSGYNIRKNGIFYNDSIYGKVRILAADKNFKLYSIIKVNDSIDGNYYAIVLDRGDNSIGIDKKNLFDIVVETQEKAKKDYGIHKNVIFEIVRIGK